MTTPAQSTKPIPMGEDSTSDHKDAVKMNQPTSSKKIAIVPPLQSGAQQSKRDQPLSPSQERDYRIGMEYIRHRRNDPSLAGHACWLYILVIFDMLTSGFLIPFTKYFAYGTPIELVKDGDKLTPGFKLLLAFRILKFSMAILLFVSLQTRKECAKLVCYKIWIYGAYLTLWKEGIVLFGTWLQFSTASTTIDGRRALLETVFNVVIRRFWIHQLEKHGKFLKAKMELIGNGLEVVQRKRAVVKVENTGKRNNVQEGTDGRGLYPRLEIESNGESSFRQPSITNGGGTATDVATASTRNNAVAVAATIPSRCEQASQTGRESPNPNGRNKVAPSRQPNASKIIEGGASATKSVGQIAVSSISERKKAGETSGTT